MTFQQCWGLAQRWYVGRDRLDWRPHTVDEMERIFVEVGLTSPFWSVRS